MNRVLTLVQPMARLLSVRKYSTKLPNELVVFLNDHMTVCWHPEPKFPYECSKPLPKPVEEPFSVLKVGEKEVNELFKKKKPKLIPEELGRLTFTTKHRWFPRSRDKMKKIMPFDRPYL